MKKEIVPLHPVFKQTIQAGQISFENPLGNDGLKGFRILETSDGKEDEYILRYARCIRCFREFFGQWRPFKFWSPFCSGCPV